MPIGPLAADAGPAASGLRGAVQAGDGLAPKRYAELVRFHRLIDRTPLPGGAPWSELAADGGYYDQSHVIRDFKRFSGSRRPSTTGG